VTAIATRTIAPRRHVVAHPPRHTPNPVVQWWVLTRRLLAPTLRNGEILTSLLAPAVFTLGFYVPLNTVMTIFGPGLSSYAQFLMPMIVLQAISFAAISSAFRAATDAVEGINRRFGSLPMPAAVPFAARMSANMIRCAISLAAAVVCGYLIGFQFYGSPAHTVGFIAFSLAIGLGLCLFGDVLGTWSRNPEGTTQALMLPQLILGMLSVGFAPVDQFPEWVQGFVRNQPISQFTYGLRALAGDSTAAAGSVTWSVMAVPLAWVVGLIVAFVPLAVYMTSRRP
jgi:ABC-2 type transport system permease protein